MLTSGFYKIIESTTDRNQVESVIELNAQHAIFKGHFPNNPVTPGVCMLQIFKNFAENHLQKKLQISECSNIKFMAIINPETHPVLKLSMTFQQTDDSTVKMKATAVYEATTALKSSLVLTIQ
ncbi:MAG TPA: hypothetical protein VLY87_03630 [Flavobacterium sp.]|nr:hypothetical protein [Flavobacterium sp.]